MTASRFLAGCAVAAFAASTVCEQPAHAQAFNATPTTVAGGVTYDRATPGQDVITVSTPSAIVNWQLTAPSPPPDPLVFLPAGNTAIFQNAPGTPDFVILNRIIPVGTSRVRMDGTVISRLQSAAGSVPGGTVIFSSPTGLIIGPTAVFDVGSLMLTTLDPLLDGNGNFFVGGNIQLTGGGTFPNAAVVTETGSSFSAPSENSWIAMVAPRVEHRGIVRVNGSAAYIAAEQVDLTIDQGLFDINIVVGTSEGNAIDHSGTTGGPASGGGGGDHHVIYLAAVPQNQAMTLLLTGNAGYDAATVAGVENGAIILSAGYDVSGTSFQASPSSITPASFRIGSGTFSSDVFGRALTDFFAGGSGPGTLTFEQDLSISALGRATLSAELGFVARVEGDALISAANTDPVSFGDPNVVGGEAQLFALSGGRVEIVGDAVVDASAVGDVDDAGNVGSGTGGRALVSADGGSIAVGGSLAVRAAGTGGDGAAAGEDGGGAGNGGTALVSALSGGTLRVGGDATVDASGTATPSTGAIPGPGSAGTGGTARIEGVGGGALMIDGTAAVVASGTGGDVAGGAGNSGGTGQGGAASVAAAGGSVDLHGGATVAANGSGGRGPDGGRGQGGDARVDAREGRVTSAGAIVADSIGTGGTTGTPGGRGGDGSGGLAAAQANSGSAEGLVRADLIVITSAGIGGSGGAGTAAIPGGRGGDGRAGNITAVAESGNGRLEAQGMTARSTGTGGNGGADGGHGGDGVAGTIVAGTVAGPAAPAVAGGAAFASVDLAAVGTGGDGAVGGTGSGGTIILASAGAPVTIAGRADLAADGTGGLGAGGVRAPAAGGDLALGAAPVGATPGNLAIGTLDGSASAFGDGSNLNVMGRWRFAANGGSAIVLGSADVRADATGTPETVESEFRLADGSLTVAGTGQFATDGAIGLNATGAGRLLGGEISFAAGVGIVIGHAGREAGAPTIDAAQFTAVTPGTYAASAGTLVIGRNGVDIQTGGNALLADTAAPDGTLQVAAGGDATLAGAATGHAVTVAAHDVLVAPGGSIGNGSTATVDVQAARDFAAAPGTTVRGTAIAIAAGEEAVLDAAAAGDRLSVTAGGTARLTGPATGREIRIASTDIDVGAVGSVGDTNSDLVALSVRPNAGETVLGGTAEGPGYTLTEAEAARIRADVLQVTAVAGAPVASQRVVVRDLTLAGGGAAAGIGAFEVATPSTVRVEGGLLIGSAGAGDRIAIDAGDRVEVVAPGAGIRVRDAAGAPAGTLTIAAADIWVADGDMLGRLSDGVDFAGRDEALRTNDGAALPRGFIEAGAIRLSPGRSLFVRNSGTAVDFAGITVGTGGLVIDPGGDQPAMVYAFGRRLNADGSFTTNIAFFRQVDYRLGASSGYTDDSEFNRCSINGGLCRAAFTRLPAASSEFTTGPFLLLPPQVPPGDPLDVTALQAEPLIEEPVTSGADATLWTDPDDDEDEEEEEEE